MSSARNPRSKDDTADHVPRHPSNDPSGTEPAGSSDGLGTRSFAGHEYAESQAEQSRGRRESMASRDNSGLGPHDQESSEDSRVNDDREGSDGARR